MIGPVLTEQQLAEHERRIQQGMVSSSLAAVVRSHRALAQELSGAQERAELLRADLKTIASSTPHNRGCDEPDDSSCPACVAAAGLAADAELTEAAPRPA